MNKLWTRLSIAFFGVIALTIVLIFSFFFALSWLTEEDFSAETYAHEYDHLTDRFVVQYIVEGKTDEEIIALLGGNDRLQNLINEIRADGVEVGMIQDQSFRRIAGDYFFELFSPDFMIIIVIGTLIGIITSIFVSRQLTRPLADLTKASYALSHQDLSQRVFVKGSEEIYGLSAAFNSMAERLERAEENRQNMLADVSHELRTPLAGLEGTLRATLDGVFDLTPEHIGNLYSQTQHLTRLVDDLHLLARAESHRLNLEKLPIDLTELIRDLAATFAVLAQNEGIKLVQNIGDVPNVEGDAIRIRQVISNLLNNALRHTSGGGTIQLSLAQIANRIEISVQDSGEGIEANYLPHLFDRFYRVDPSRSRESGGTGLGLAIAKALVEAHGGSISAESGGPGNGSTFKIVFPI